MNFNKIVSSYGQYQGRIQDFKLGGGGGALKKIAPSGGRLENFWGISCEKSRFYAKKSYFSNFRGAREIFGVFHVKNHDFTPKKIIFFPILGGGGGRGAPPLNPPLNIKLSRSIKNFPAIAILIYLF